MHDLTLAVHKIDCGLRLEAWISGQSTENMKCLSIIVKILI